MELTLSQTSPYSRNSLPNNKCLGWTKFKASVYNKLNLVDVMISGFDWVENIVGKEENAGNHHFLLFPQCFP